MTADDGGWEEAEQALRRHYRSTELHLIERLTDEPPYKFHYWLSPDCHSTSRIHRGRRLYRGGGLAELEGYLRDVGFVDKPQYHAFIRGLINDFEAHPPVSFGSSPWSSERVHADLRPRVETEDGLVRVVLSYVDESPIDAARRENRGRRVMTPGGPRDEIELPCPVERFTLEIRREAPLAWQKETFERTLVELYEVPAPTRRAGRVIGIAVVASVVVAGIAYALLAARR